MDKAAIHNFCDLLSNDPLLQGEQVVICPPYTYLDFIKQCLPSTLHIGAQNCSGYDHGSYTGEISCKMLYDCDCRYVIIGHCESRINLQEDNKLLAKKILIAENYNIIPIFCIGETLLQKDKGIACDILRSQLELLSNNSSAIIAYEPIWAIGSGKIPNIEDIYNTVAFIKDITANKHLVLYGGSVNTSNIKKLKTVSNVDGFLIGSASNDATNFIKIITG